jgi:hypothetical protein
MIRSTLIAAAALATLVAAAPAEATVRFNGASMNGIKLNGFTLNGAEENGMRLNGKLFNSKNFNGNRFNGTAAQSFAPALESLILPSGVILLAR